MIYFVNSNELYHHGVKGMKWGVRRYQNYDGSYKAGARGRNYQENGSTRQNGSKRNTESAPKEKFHLSDKQKKALKVAGTIAVSAAVAYGGYKLYKHLNDPISAADPNLTRAGKKAVDTCIKSGTEFSRIQIANELEEHPFFATYEESDKKFYEGLFGKNLYNRANAEARRALKNATTDEKIAAAQKLVEQAKNTQVHRLSIEAVKDVKIPSTDKAADVMHELMSDSGFKDDLKKSIEDSASKMKRPNQQAVFGRALKVLKKEGSLNSNDKETLYKAFNMSLTNHNDYENRTQEAFYGQLKKLGYSALTDINDRDLSSYHAKHPVIVFDQDAVVLRKVANIDLNSPELTALTVKANATRASREQIGLPASVVKETFNASMGTARDYVDSLRKKVFK